jgi:hypothetical protein
MDEYINEDADTSCPLFKRRERAACMGVSYNALILHTVCCAMLTVYVPVKSVACGGL